MLVRLYLFRVSPSGRWGRRGLCSEDAPGFIQTKVAASKNTNFSTSTVKLLKDAEHVLRGLRYNIEVDGEMSCSVLSGSPYVVRIVQGSRDRSAGGGYSLTSVQALSEVLSEDQLWSESIAKGNNNKL